MSYRSLLLFLLSVVLLVCSCNEDEETEPVVQMQEQSTGEMTEAERNIVDLKQTLVMLETSMGDIVIELNEQAAPVTVQNFLGYVETGFYDGTIFHRVISGFMIQGGGFTEDMERKQTRSPIVNEAANGLKNDRGTIAMARTDLPNSATSQFFINHRNNTSLNYIQNVSAGYAVFGRVTEGMDVVDAIALVETTSKLDARGVQMADVPVEPVIIKSASVVSE